MHLAHSSSSQSISELRLTPLQYLVTVSARLRNTPACIVIYLVLLVLNVSVIVIDTMGVSTRHTLTIVIESIINTVLLLEIVLSLAHSGRGYFYHWANVFDLCLTLLCLLFFLLFLVKDTNESETYSVIDIIVLIVRYCFQITRISIIVYRSHRASDVLVQEDVNFTIPAMREKIETELASSDFDNESRNKNGKSKNKREKTSLLLEERRRKNSETRISLIDDHYSMNTDSASASDANGHSADYDAIDRLEKAMCAHDAENEDNDRVHAAIVNITPIRSSLSLNSLSKRSNSPAGKLSLTQSASLQSLRLISPPTSDQLLGDEREDVVYDDVSL